MKEEELQFASIAAIRTLYDAGNDMLDAVCSAVLLVFEDGFTIQDLAKSYTAVYSVDMPIDMLTTVLKRLRKKGFVEYVSLKEPSSKVSLTSEGSIEKNVYEESVKGVQREFGSLINDFKKHLERENVNVDKAEKLLLSFIDENLGLTSSVISGNGGRPSNNSPVAEFIIKIEKSSPDKFEILQRIFFGRLYLNLMKTRTDYSRDASFGELEVIFDTNIIFNILGLHGKDARERALELLSVLGRNKQIKPVVLDVTIEEVKRVLRAYETQKGEYYDQYAVDSLYQQIKSRGFDSHKVALLIEEVQEELEKSGVLVKYTTNELIKEAESNTKLLNNISTWAELLGNDKRENAVIHDAIVISTLRMCRGKISSGLLEKNKAVLISNDTSLKELSLEDLKKHGGVQLVWRPVEIISYLWVRDIGNEEIATSVIRQGIMAYAREKMINHNLWEKFIRELKKARKEEKLSDSQIGYILAAEETRQILATEKEKGIDRLVSQSYVSKLAEDTSKLAKGSSNYQKVVNQARQKSRSFAVILVSVLAIIIVSILTVGLFFIVHAFGWNNLEPIIWVIGSMAIIMATLIFGKPPEGSKKLLELREKVITKTEKAICRKLANYLDIVDLKS